MRIRNLHPWNVTPAEARRIQETLRNRVATTCAPGLPLPPGIVAGIDVAVPRDAGVAIAGVIVMRLPSMEVVERRSAVSPLTFPYVPGFLSFREGESVIGALRGVRHPVDVFLFDGQGICHPRRFGLASHLGVILDRPTVGCAKSLLLGRHGEPAAARGSRRRIFHGKETVGLALRTRRAVKPVYVSIGHLVDLPAASRIVSACCRGYRLPEPLREAHRWVTELSRQHRPGNPLPSAGFAGGAAVKRAGGAMEIEAR